MKGMPAAANCAACSHHALAPVGRHDADGDVVRLAHLVQVRVLHRAGMKGGDLVVVQVGGDEGLRGVLAVDDPHVVVRHAGCAHPLPVRAEVAPTVAIGQPASPSSRRL